MACTLLCCTQGKFVLALIIPFLKKVCFDSNYCFSVQILIQDTPEGSAQISQN